MTSISVLGGGKIGEALISGLINSGVEASDITVSNRREERGQELVERYGVNDVRENSRAAADADVIFLCVKPYMIIDVLEEISEVLENNDSSSTIVSMAAGITLAAMEETLTAGSSVIRVMPNTPMMVGKGVNAVAPGAYVTDEQLELVTSLLSAVGTAVTVQESEMDAVTAMSGSSPAYIFLVAESLIDAGVQLGLKRDTAQALVTHAIEGAGTMLVEREDDPTQLRINVSSPAGTTVAALRELEESGIRGTFFRAAEACATRSKELGSE